MLDETAISANTVNHSDLWTRLKLVVQPPRHSVLPGIGSELGFLEESAMFYCQDDELTPKRALLIGGLMVRSAFAKGLKPRMLLPIVLFSLSLVSRL
jgi:hypothetical protein